MIRSCFPRLNHSLLLAFVLVASLIAPTAWGGITVSKSFSPASITAGTTSTLSIVIQNNPPPGSTGSISFTDIYPLNLKNTATPAATNDCGGTIIALAGGSSLSFSGGSLNGNNACTVTVNVTSTVAGSYLNNTGPVITTFAGTGAATATLTVTGAVSVAVDHIRIEHDGNALTCTAETLTVKACANAACSSLNTADTVSGNVTWAGSPGGSVPFTITAGGTGQTTVSLPVPTAQTVTLGTSAVSPAPANTSQCLNTATATSSCAMTFNTSGFLVTVPDHVSCTNTTATIEAVQQGAPLNRCIPAFASVTHAVNLFTSYVSPATGTMAATASTGSVSTSSPGTVHNLAFDATGRATITFNYPDAGQLTLNANGTAPTGAAMTGNATFVVTPASLVFSGIPAAPLKAGQPFNVTVTAKNACTTPATTPNFTAQTVTITSSNPQPGLGNATAINTTLTATGGAGSINLTWDEVGTIDLTANRNNYLGSALSVSGSQTGVGRFQPAYFDTVVTPGCSAFTYAGSITPAKVGQPFTVTTTAKGVGGSVTRNYAGASYAYLTTLSNAGVTTGFSNNTMTATDFVNGIATRSDVTYAVADPKTAPLTLSLRATNSDTPAVSSSGFVEGITEIRSGRLRLQNAYGSELLILPIPLEAQYWSGSSYIRNQQDNCTTLPASSIAMGNYTSALAACETQIGYSNGSGALVNGVSGYLRLTKPGAANNGSVKLTLNLNSASGSTCTSPTASAATNANLPWFGADPTSRATFGIYKTPIIYIRENY